MLNMPVPASITSNVPAALELMESRVLRSRRALWRRWGLLTLHAAI